MSEPLDFILLIPCYNNLLGLRRSLTSVVYAPERYGVLIVDDGSDIPIDPDMLNVLASSAMAIIRLPINSGITAALNAGLEWLRQRENYRFVARLDCGDICHPQRFKRQVGFLTMYPDVELLGTWARFQNFSTGFSFRYKTPLKQDAIIRGMHFRNLFIHPTVMWRPTILAKVDRYPTDLPHAEDYGFFYQILRYGQAAILPEELVICEINPKGISLQNRRLQLKSRIKTVFRYGTNRMCRLIGILKLTMMLFVPYRIILLLKLVK